MKILDLFKRKRDASGTGKGGVYIKAERPSAKVEKLDNGHIRVGRFELRQKPGVK